MARQSDWIPSTPRPTATLGGASRVKAITPGRSQCIEGGTRWDPSGPSGGTPRRNGSRMPSGWRALAIRLPALLKGNDRPEEIADSLAVAKMCYDTKRFAAAARFWAEALEADPRIGDDRRATHRYDAACAAALAAAGHGKDDPPPDSSAKAKLKSQALGWLKAELEAWAKLMDAGDPKAPALVIQTLQRWLADRDLAAIRDALALAALPSDEQKAWRTLWADVDLLRKRAVKSRALVAKPADEPEQQQ